MVVVEFFDGVAVENGNDGTGGVGSKNSGWDEQGCQQQELCPVRDHSLRKVATDCHRVARR